MTNKIKIKKIISIIFNILLVSLVIFISLVLYYKKRIDNGDLIKWKGHFYTKEEFHNIVPPQNYHVEAKNTPEDVYKGFRQAILNNDIDKALGFIVEKNREKYKKVLEDNKKREHWASMLPKSIVKDSIVENYAYYTLDMGTSNKNDIVFIKTPDGYWKIENI